MEISLKTAFSILDGRLSTNIGDVYKMLNYIFNDNLSTHQLLVAIKKIKEVKPDWFANGVNVIKNIKETNNTGDFDKLMEVIDNEFATYKIKLGRIKYKIDPLEGLV